MAFRSRKNKKDLCKPQPPLSKTRRNRPGQLTQQGCCRLAHWHRHSVFDFYIYATAAVIVFPHIFFPQGDAAAATLQSLATFAIAFVARPIGSALFGHFGDRVGRKVTLVASLLTMGISTVVIGLLPGYESIGIVAPMLLALARFGQGLGLGGEWGGAALLATENAPARKRALYGSFPQLGAPIRLLLRQRHLPAALLAADRPAVYWSGAGACRLSSPRCW